VKLSIKRTHQEINEGKGLKYWQIYSYRDFFFISASLSLFLWLYESVSNSFRTESITKYMLTTIHTRWEATKSVMAAKLTRLTHKIAVQLHLVAESSIICSCRSRRPVRKLLDTPSYVLLKSLSRNKILQQDGNRSSIWIIATIVFFLC
jgi:hypothetical protein